MEDADNIQEQKLYDEMVSLLDQNQLIPLDYKQHVT